MTRPRRSAAARLSAALVGAVVAASLGAPPASAAGDVTHFDLDGPDNRPYSIVLGPDGNMWFTQSDGNAIGRITPDGALTSFELPTADSQPYGITAGPADGNLWFTERLANRIGVMDTAGTLLAEYDLPTQDAQPWDIALVDGALWFTEKNVDQVGRITLDGAITEYPVDPGSSPTGIAPSGSQGHVWFTAELGNAIGRINPRKAHPIGSLKLFPVKTEGARPWEIIAGPNNKMYFTEMAGHHLGRIKKHGKMKEFPVPGESGIAGIAVGGDGNLWFTLNDIAQVRAMSPFGDLLAEIYPTRPSPFGIAIGPNTALYFCEGLGNSIGRI